MAANSSDPGSYMPSSVFTALGIADASATFGVAATVGVVLVEVAEDVDVVDFLEVEQAAMISTAKKIRVNLFFMLGFSCGM